MLNSETFPKTGKVWMLLQWQPLAPSSWGNIATLDVWERSSKPTKGKVTEILRCNWGRVGKKLSEMTTRRVICGELSASCLKIFFRWSVWWFDIDFLRVLAAKQMFCCLFGHKFPHSFYWHFVGKMLGQLDHWGLILAMLLCLPLLSKEEAPLHTENVGCIWYILIWWIRMNLSVSCNKVGRVEVLIGFFQPFGHSPRPIRLHIPPPMVRIKFGRCQ